VEIGAQTYLKNFDSVINERRLRCFGQWTCLTQGRWPITKTSRDVRNRFFKISVLFRFGFLKKTRIWFGMNLVPRFGSKNAVRCGYHSYLLLM